MVLFFVSRPQTRSFRFGPETKCSVASTLSNGCSRTAVAFSLCSSVSRAGHSPAVPFCLSAPLNAENVSFLASGGQPGSLACSRLGGHALSRGACRRTLFGGFVASFFLKGLLGCGLVLLPRFLDLNFQQSAFASSKGFSKDLRFAFGEFPRLTFAGFSNRLFARFVRVAPQSGDTFP